MDDIAPEYDVVVMGTGMNEPHPLNKRPLGADCVLTSMNIGLTECVLSG